MWTVTIIGYGNVVENATASLAIAIARIAQERGQEVTLSLNGEQVNLEAALASRRMASPHC